MAKYNHVNKKQERILCITDKAVYNISPAKFLQKLISRVVSVRIKRRIPLNKIYGMTLSRFGTQFIIHVPDEHDYLMQSADFNDKIVETLCFAYYHFNQKKMAFYYRVKTINQSITLQLLLSLSSSYWNWIGFNSKRMTWRWWHFARRKQMRKTKEAISQKMSHRYELIIIPSLNNHNSLCGILFTQYLDPESMLNNENAKGKSDLVFTRNNAGSTPFLSLSLFIVFNSWCNSNYNVLFHRTKVQSYQSMISIWLKCLVEVHLER